MKRVSYIEYQILKAIGKKIVIISANDKEAFITIIK